MHNLGVDRLVMHSFDFLDHLANRGSKSNNKVVNKKVMTSEVFSFTEVYQYIM